MSMLPCVEINPICPPKASIIWLHGLGADGHDFAAIVPQLDIPEKLGLRFVFPHAPVRPITINNGYKMRGWYDITGFDLASRQDSSGIRASEKAIIELIKKEKAAGIPSHKILLAGFSQGGAIALHTGLRHPETLGGILALSTYLPLAATVDSERSNINQQIPIFLAHGAVDSIIPLNWGEITKQSLQQLGYLVEWHTYPIDHTVSLPEITDIRNWIIKNLSGSQLA